jgi:hypothetical protein
MVLGIRTVVQTAHPDDDSHDLYGTIVGMRTRSNTFSAPKTYGIEYAFGDPNHAGNWMLIFE